MNNKYGIKNILLDHASSTENVIQEVHKKLPDTPLCKISEEHQMGKGDSFELGKDTLFFLNHKGKRLKACPGTKGYICCGYQILNLATNCPLDCSYCVLQSYFNQPYLRIFRDVEQEVQKVFDHMDGHPDQFFRLGTGEFTDSLALDPLLCWTRRLVPLAAARPNVVLEFKTKTDHVKGLLALKERKNIIVSWSLNSPHIAHHEEHGAASLKKRLLAAEKCQSEGFALGFHFDPLIIHPNWHQEYLKTLEMLDRLINPKGIVWISLGSFRFMPELKPIIRKRHPGSCVLNGEFIVGLDGKMRYFKPLRMELYAFMKEHLHKWYSDPGLYLCMESDEIWAKTMGWSPHDSDGLSRFLDLRAKKFFP